MAPKRKAVQQSVRGAGKRLALGSAGSPGKASPVKSVRDLFQSVPDLFKSAQGAPKASRPTPARSSRAQDDTPWTDRYRPKGRSELAVHKKKLEVRAIRP